MSGAELEKEGMVQFPAIIGGTVPVFNVEGLRKGDLKITGPVLADMFLGKINKWNDPRIAELNPGKKLPDAAITVVHRADGSGTTFNWTDYLSSVSTDWLNTVGRGAAVKWPAPTSVGGKGNEGVAGVISNTPGAIGYLNQAFVKGKIRAAALQNRSGAFVKPNLASGSAALNNIKLNAMLAGEDANPAGAGSYPISTLTWILAYQKGNGAKAATIQKAMDYLLGPAQNRADDLGYVPLKGSVLTNARKAIDRIGK